jgi:hypothetical protein
VKLECHEIEEFTGAYLADQLTVQERFRMEMHLNECASCSSDISELSSFADMLTQDFESEEQEPELSVVHRENLRVAWNQANPSLQSSRSSQRFTRRAVALFATAASLMFASYFGFVSGQQQVQQTSQPIQVATIPFHLSADTVAELSSNNNTPKSVVGMPYDELIRIARTELPEYGIGTAMLASRPRVSNYVGGLPVPQPKYVMESYASYRASHAGLPVPSPRYTIDNVSFGYK